MKKFLSVIVFMMTGIFTVTAQPPKGMGNNDPDAKKILDAVSAKFKTFKTVQSKFSLKIDRSCIAE